MTITFDEIATLWKALNPPQRTAFTNAIKQVATDNKDEKSVGICRNSLVILKTTASNELIVILDKIIADFNGNQSALKALLNDEIIRNDAQRFIGIIALLAEENQDDQYDPEPPAAVAGLHAVPIRTGLGVANSIGGEHLVNRRFEQAFWFYLSEAVNSNEVVLDTLGYTLIMARHDLFLNVRNIECLRTHIELLFNALIECYNFQINKLDTKEITATLEAYIDLLEKLHANDFPLEDILDLISRLQKANIPFGTLINTHLDAEQKSQYERWLEDLRKDHKQIEVTVTQLRSDVLASASAAVVTTPALEKEMTAAQARTERVVASVDDKADDHLPPLTISSKAVSMGPSRTASSPPSPKHGAFFATTNAPPTSPKNSPPKQPKPFG